MAMREINVGRGSEDEQIKFEKEGDLLEGHYLRKETFTYEGREISKYYFQTTDGEQVSTLGSFKINEGMERAVVGSKMRITYTGKEKLGGGRTLKKFKFEQDDEDTIDVA